MFNDLA